MTDAEALDRDVPRRRLPWPAALINQLGRRHAARLRFEPALLMARAARATGLRDFAPDPQFSEGLGTLCDSIEADVRPTLTGRILLRLVLSQALKNRLLWVHHRRSAPERLRRRIHPPLLVVGLMRTGTTLLHRLLSLDEGARALPMWQLPRTFPPLGRDLRRLETSVVMGGFAWAARDIGDKHPSGVDAPEECMVLLDSSMVSMGYWVLAPVYAYLAWWRRQDKTGPYEQYREHLAWYQAASPGARLTLKAPAHTGCLDAFLSAIPDVMVVQTHRDPAVAIPSMNSLLSSFHGSVSAAPDWRRMGAANADLCRQMLDDNQRTRARLASGAILDVQYEDLIADRVAVIRRVYRHFGLRWSPAFEARLGQSLVDERRSAGPRHVYRAESFGQTDAGLRSQFADYARTYLHAGGAARRG